MTNEPTSIHDTEPTSVDVPFSADHEEESLVPDWRGGLTPAQLVENKLVALLKASPIAMSRLQKSARPGR